jgi:transglutaminase-like putative cysteine protease
MAKFKIQHVTKYTYEIPVRDSANQIMLYPLDDDYQEVLIHKLLITGNPSVEQHLDIFNNTVGTFTHAQPHNELVIDSQIEVLTKSRTNPVDSVPPAQQWEDLEKIKHEIPFIDFLRIEPFAHLAELENEIQAPKDEALTPLLRSQMLCEYVYTSFEYKKGITTIETTLNEIWSIKSGVCQDFAHILLAILRLAKIPARYVSGYICPNKNGMRGEGATHAWVEAYIPFYGWLGLDPTNNCIANENHVRLAVGKNFSDCSPVKGTYRGTSNHTLEVAVAVSYEDGKTSKDTMEPDQPLTSFTKNSFQRHQEAQMQQ